MKYGKMELRTWTKPRWFHLAFGKSGWIWSENRKVVGKLISNPKWQRQNYELIHIHRLGNYDARITELKQRYKSKKIESL